MRFTIWVGLRIHAIFTLVFLSAAFYCYTDCIHRLTAEKGRFEMIQRLALLILAVVTGKSQFEIGFLYFLAEIRLCSRLKVPL